MLTRQDAIAILHAVSDGPGVNAALLKKIDEISQILRSSEESVVV